MLVGVLGLGRMGLPITQALAAANFQVVAFDPVTHPGGSAESVIELAEILVTVLPGAAEVAALDVPAGKFWIDLTSSDPRVTGVRVGAPMGGGPAAAVSRTLKFFVGGASADVERARPLLETLGTIDHIGENVGDGYTAKLLANLLWFGQAVAVTEALLLGQSLGIQPAVLKKTLQASAGSSVFIDGYLDALLDGDYLESFGIDRVVEELDILTSLARETAVPFELSELVARQHREALEHFGAVPGELLAAKLLEERAGRQLRR